MSSMPADSSPNADPGAGSSAASNAEGEQSASASSLLCSVIIPAYGDAPALARCLDALAAQTLTPQAFEVIVVDNASPTPLAPVVSGRRGVRSVREDEPGSYAARNRGLLEAQGRVLAFTDADCRPAPDWLARGLAQLEGGERDIVLGGRVELRVEDPRAPSWAERYELALGFPQQDYITRGRFSVTANLFTTRRVIERVGPFNPGLKSGGDKEWGQRASAAGVELVYADDVVVVHPARRGLADLVNKRRRQVGGQLDRMRERWPTPIAYALVFGKAVAPPVERTLRVLRDGRLAPIERLRTSGVVCGVSFALQLGSVLELAQRALGADAKR